jgi:hypothetical protein
MVPPGKLLLLLLPMLLLKLLPKVPLDLLPAELLPNRPPADPALGCQLEEESVLGCQLEEESVLGCQLEEESVLGCQLEEESSPLLAPLLMPLIPPLSLEAFSECSSIDKQPSSLETKQYWSMTKSHLRLVLLWRQAGAVHGEPGAVA